MNDTIRDLIKSRGYWDVEIRPATFNEDRVRKKTELASILLASAVQMRGWDFPHLDRQQGPKIQSGWVDQETRWNHYLESMRFYQSGLFVDLSAFKEDWRDQSELWPADKHWRWGTEIGVEEIVFRLTEIFGFASRLSNSPAGDEVMHVGIRCVGLAGRKLAVGLNRMPFFPAKETNAREFSYSCEVTRPQLVTPGDLALPAASELFDLFAWDVAESVLRDIQGELGRFVRR